MSSPRSELVESQSVLVRGIGSHASAMATVGFGCFV